MTKGKITALLVAGFFLSGCAQLTSRQKAALTGAAICGTAGAAAGGIIAHNSDNHRASEGQGIPIGAITGAVLCGSLAYLLAEEPKPEPKPAPPAPRPAPPKPKPAPPKPKPVLPPPPPPPPAPKPAPAPKVERTIILDHVLFDFDKTAIKPDGAKILDRLVAFLKENPSKKVELEGHTDWIGTDQYNQGLSERRAASVRNYLVKQGVATGRIATRGFGEAKPIADNKTRDGRAKNRRVEGKVR